MTTDRWGLNPTIRRNLLWKIGATGAEKVLRLGLVVTAARLLGPEGWGQYTYALTLAFLAVQLADLGLGLFLSRELAQDTSPAPALLGQTLGVKVTLLTLYVAVMVALAIGHGAEPVVQAALLGCALIAAGQSVVEFASHVFRGLQDLSLEARATTTMAAVQVTIGGVALVWLWRSGDKSNAVGVYVAALALAGCVGAWLAWRRVSRRLPHQLLWSRPMWGRFRREVLPLGVAIVASLIYYKVDVPMIRALRDDAETGLYTASYKLLEVLAVVPSVLLAALFPALSENVAHHPERARALHKTTLGWLSLAGLAAGGVFALAPEWIVWILYGDRFRGAASLLPVLGASVTLVFINYLQTHMLVALGMVRAQMWISLGLIGVNVGLNWLWIPSHGSAGAAWATWVTELCLCAAVSPLVYVELRRRGTSTKGRVL